MTDQWGAAGDRGLGEPGRRDASSPASEQVTLHRDELQRIRDLATEIRAELTEQRDFVQRKLDERDQDLRKTLDDLHRLEHEVEGLRDKARAAEHDLPAMRQKVAEVENAYRNMKRQYDRLQARRLVRIALAIAAFFRPLFQVVRALRGGGTAPPPLRVTQPESLEITDRQRTEIEEEALESLLEAALVEQAPRSGPKVSIIVLNRSGEHHLRRLMPGLERTAYEDLEVIVVDNASDDGSLRYLHGLRPRYDLGVLENDENRSFADATNQGVAAASGELLLLLNNDIEPIAPGWLGHMVGTLRDTGAGAVGARLVYPHRPGLDNVGDTVHPDLSLQHRGIHFAHGKDGYPLPRNLGSGEDPLSTTADAVREVPALTAACLLVRKDVYEEVGGLDAEYTYGTEDVDLCLKLRDAGYRIVYDGHAALWHHEFGTQNLEGREFKADNRRRNRKVFVDRWGPQLFRQVLTDRTRGDRRWSEAPLRVVVAGRPAEELDLGGLGWELNQAARDKPGELVVPTEADVIVSGSALFDVREAPANLVRVALVLGDVERWVAAAWFDDYDVVLAPDEATAGIIRRRSNKTPAVLVDEVSVGAQVRDALLRWVASTRVALLISTPGWDVAEWWGDTHYARAVQRYLERRGYPTRIVLRRDFAAPWVAGADVALHLLGLTEHEPRNPGQVSVLWNISHPELVSPELVDRYDLALIASDRYAEALAQQVDTPVAALHQATDHEKFRPVPDGPHHELLFVANSRRTRRRIVDDLTPTTFDLAIYGNDWFPELVHPRHVRGEVVPNDELPAYYAGADVVLNDHWDEMREYGFVSNRIYDAFAAGAFVVSDQLAELEDEFDGAVLTYEGHTDLEAKLRHHLDHPEERAARAERGRRAVLQRHTFEHRVDAILSHLEPLLVGHERWVVEPDDLDVATPQPEPAHRSAAPLL